MDEYEIIAAYCQRTGNCTPQDNATLFFRFQFKAMIGTAYYGYQRCDDLEHTQYSLALLTSLCDKRTIKKLDKVVLQKIYIDDETFDEREDIGKHIGAKKERYMTARTD